MNDRPATLADVAARAGVSPMTVSRVINDRGGASEETRQRVIGAVDALNYRPNTFAKALKSNRSDTVAIVVPDIVNPFFPEIIRGAELTARPAGYTLLSCNIVEDPRREEQVLDTLLERRVNGVIICSARLEQGALIRAVRRHRAAVLINRSAPKSIAGTIEVDYRAGVAAAVDALVAERRRHLVYLAGPANSYGGGQRRLGLRDGLSAHGLCLAAELPVSPDLAGGAAAAKRLLNSGVRFDAVVCYNDLIALGLMGGFRESGVSIPDDVAIVGCDDILPASLVSPPLSTLRVEKEKLGAAAMSMLIDRMEHRSVRRGIVVEPELVLRGTTRTCEVSLSRVRTGS